MSVTNVNIPTTQSFVLVDTRTGPNKVLFLPAASTIQGRFLSIKDYYGGATASSMTISTTGLDRIDQGGIRYTLASSFGSVALISDGFRSWNMMGLYDGADTAASMLVIPGAVMASGGTVTTNGAYTIHTFPTVGTATFTLTSPASITAQVLVLGGGGGGGSWQGGGGGAGGAVFNGSLTITSGTYNVVVGDGGAGDASTGAGYSTGGFIGGNSSFNGLTGQGGGGGGTYIGPAAGTSGGCGGGSAYISAGAAGTQGFAGGSSLGDAGGGGGMGSVGLDGGPGTGGNGFTYTLANTAYLVAGGGGAGQNSAGGTGGGGGGGNDGTPKNGYPGTTNKGGGGGGGGRGGSGGKGGSGVVIIAYQIDTRPAKYSALFNAANNPSLTIPANSALTLGTNNHTVEFWMYQTSRNTYACPFVYGNTSYYAANNYYMDAGESGLGFVVGNGSGDWAININGGAARSLNTWHHYAIVRNGTTFTFYINGTSVGSATSSINITAQGDVFKIGNHSSYPINGYISNFRLVNGTAVYTSNFTPPTSPLTAIPNTQILIQGLVDNSPNAFTVTNNGSVTLSTTISPFA